MAALVQAYLDCRANKRNSASALAFELQAERQLCALLEELQAGAYRPGRSICFVVTRPKPREVWAADFRDRVVHHLLYNHIAPRFHAGFVAGSSACIPGRGTLYAAQRVLHGARSVTLNWSRPAAYLKCDLANFFVAIDKHILLGQLARRVHEPAWLALAETILLHDPRGADQKLRMGMQRASWVRGFWGAIARNDKALQSEGSAWAETLATPPPPIVGRAALCLCSAVGAARYTKMNRCASPIRPASGAGPQEFPTNGQINVALRSE